MDREKNIETKEDPKPTQEILPQLRFPKRKAFPYFSFHFVGQHSDSDCFCLAKHHVKQRLKIPFLNQNIPGEAKSHRFQQLFLSSPSSLTPFPASHPKGKMISETHLKPIPDISELFSTSNNNFYTRDVFTIAGSVFPKPGSLKHKSCLLSQIHYKGEKQHTGTILFLSQLPSSCFPHAKLTSELYELAQVSRHCIHQPH